MSGRWIRNAALVITGGWMVACSSAVTGNEGNFVFSYAADDNVLDFNKPVAVGARLDLMVTEVGTRKPVSLTDASTDDPAVMEVVEFGGSQLTIEGVGEGNVLVEVAGTTPAGDELTDSVNMNAAIPQVHKLIHTCDRLADTAAYLTDNDVVMEFEFLKENGQNLIGYGYYPITLTGNALELDAEASGQLWMQLVIGPTPGTVQMVSDIDGTKRTLEVVAPGSIDGVREPVDFVWEDIDVGDTNAFYVLPTVGELVVCQAQTPMEVESLTPEICSVKDTGQTNDNSEWGWFDVTGVAAGTCEFQVTYPAGNGGAGASATFTYPIEP